MVRIVSQREQETKVWKMKHNKVSLKLQDSEKNLKAMTRKYESLVKLIDQQDGIQGNFMDQIREMQKRVKMLSEAQRRVDALMGFEAKYRNLKLIDMQDGYAGNVEEQIQA